MGHTCKFVLWSQFPKLLWGSPRPAPKSDVQLQTAESGLRGQSKCRGHTPRSNVAAPLPPSPGAGAELLQNMLLAWVGARSVRRFAVKLDSSPELFRVCSTRHADRTRRSAVRASGLVPVTHAPLQSWQEEPVGRERGTKEKQTQQPRMRRGATHPGAPVNGAHSTLFIDTHSPAFLKPPRQGALDTEIGRLPVPEAGSPKSGSRQTGCLPRLFHASDPTSGGFWPIATSPQSLSSCPMASLPACPCPNPRTPVV